MARRVCAGGGTSFVVTDPSFSVDEIIHGPTGFCATVALFRLMGSRLSDMLFEGEIVEDEIALSKGTVAVTSHRVLAFAERGDTRRFEHADLPNVEDVRTQTKGDFRYLNWGIRSGVIGILMLGGGVLLQTNPRFQQMFETLEKVQSTGSVAGVGEMIGTIVTFLSLLNIALVFVGLVATMGALGLIGLYLNSRQRELVIDVIERDSIRVPVEDEEEAAHATSRLKGTL